MKQFLLFLLATVAIQIVFVNGIAPKQHDIYLRLDNVEKSWPPPGTMLETESEELLQHVNRGDDLLAQETAEDNVESTIPKLVEVTEVVEEEPTLGDIRIRSDGSSMFFEGRVEYRLNETWEPVCYDHFDKKAADVACRQLGFPKGAAKYEMSNQHGVGEGIVSEFPFSTLSCSGSEEKLADCPWNRDRPCILSSAAVSCKINKGCPPGWFFYNSACYHVNQTVAPYEESKEACLNSGGRLAMMTSKEENSFISNYLNHLEEPNEAYWIGGKRSFQCPNNDCLNNWKWEGENRPIVTNSSDNWLGGMSMKVLMYLFAVENCMTLSDVHNPLKKEGGVWRKTTEYLWEPMGCLTRLPSICMKTLYGRTETNTQKVNRIRKTDPQDCYSLLGLDYRGTASRTEGNYMCKNWNHPKVKINEPWSTSYGLGDHNYCRNPDNEKKPWCWINPDTLSFDYCAIPSCDTGEANDPTEEQTAADVGGSGFGLDGCDADAFLCPKTGLLPDKKCLDKNLVCDGNPDCGMGEDEAKLTCGGMDCSENQFFCTVDKACISNTKKCDGFKDCTDGADELNCQIDTEVQTKFRRNEGTYAQSSMKAILMGFSFEACVQNCASYYTLYKYNFVCKALNYIVNPGFELYALCELLPGYTTTRPQANSVFLEQITETCTEFACANEKCISKDLVCNNVNDCGDASDEAACPESQNDYAVRLVNTHDEDTFGRLEVHRFGEWGQVCIYGFNKQAGDVACRELGFKEGIKGLSAGSKGLSYGNGKIILDGLGCEGNEDSLAACQHKPWFQHSCSPEHAVYLECYKERECRPWEFRCDDGSKCLSKSQICDDVSDCADNSDEKFDCTINIRLDSKEENPNEGRIVITRGPLEGTLCADYFDKKVAEVVCRWLGIEGGVSVVPPDVYGPGLGPVLLDDVKCQGTESNLMECEHRPWAQHDCNHFDDAAVSCGIKEEVPEEEPEPEVPDEDECGIREFEQWSSHQSRVVGGYVAQPAAFPWQARVWYKSQYHHCGGTIINEKWILSAAHCYNGRDNAKYDMEVRVGDLNQGVDDEGEQAFEIANIIMHPKYNTIVTLNYDFAMIKIKPNSEGKYIKFGRTVRKACLPNQGQELQTGHQCLVSGWGLTRENGVSSRVLMAATVPIIGHEDCKRGYSQLTNVMQCAGFAHGTIDTCSGDSGGPLVCVDENKKYTVFGATSYGLGCARPGYPGVYAKVSQEMEWIQNILNNY